ncbi:MAG: hypothetical protein Q4F29_11745, partial [Lachnospiraceae bacterium]|nr:hypothetical protein [Lachnospiraceae bacterium]
QKSMKIDFVDGIFACDSTFSYGQRSKCADLLNSYQDSLSGEINFPEISDFVLLFHKMMI